jgi:hypothetical protein
VIDPSPANPIPPCPQARPEKFRGAKNSPGRKIFWRKKLLYIIYIYNIVYIFS